MTLKLLRTTLLWSAVINYAALLAWFALFVFAHDLMWRVQGRWFHVSVETFDALHYGCMGIYKIAILVFNLVPLAALWIAGRDGSAVESGRDRA